MRKIAITLVFLIVMAPLALAQGEPVEECVSQCLSEDCKLNCILHLCVSADCMELCLGYGISEARCTALCGPKKVTTSVEPPASGQELTTGSTLPAGAWKGLESCISECEGNMYQEACIMKCRETLGSIGPAPLTAGESAVFLPFLLGAGIILAAALFIHHSPKFHYGAGNSKDTRRKEARTDRKRRKVKGTDRKKGRRKPKGKGRR